MSIPKRLSNIYEELKGGFGVVLGLPITDEFIHYHPSSLAERFIQPLSGKVPRFYHVVAATSASISDEQFVLIRNSWGPDWGINGYAYLSHEYIENAVTDAYRVTVSR
ncbi:C1 family peptidase [Streptomyces sp. C10-9-1]|uniref:C1 family peptidase n=1 Tax=Streptomyces sp. C10-9-1 TaxID=1859285 RepID=UPI003D7597F1